jgi:hypothetical protein
VAIAPMLLRRRMSRFARATVNVAGSTFQRRKVAGPDSEQAHREAPHFAVHSSSGTERRNTRAIEADPAAEEEIGRDAAPGAQSGARATGKCERAKVLQEEVPLLGEEQIEPGEVYLLLVDLYLGKIGVDREVDRQILSHAVPEIASDSFCCVVRQTGRHSRVGCQT